MIVIKKPYIIEQNNKNRLCANIVIPQKAYEKWVEKISGRATYKGYEKAYYYPNEELQLWYEVEMKYGSSLCTERSDAFVLAVLYFAMVTGEDIHAEGAVSNELFHNLNRNLIPLHCNEKTGYRRIVVRAKTESTPLKTEGNNATGISCGVDSFDTVFTYLAKDIDEEHKLTALTVFNVGSYNNMPDMKLRMKKQLSIEEYHKKAESYFEYNVRRGEKIAQELNLNFLAVNSNINSLYQGVFLELHAYVNISAVMAVQKYFAHYYYASAGEPDKESIGLENDASDNVRLYSTETVKVYLGREEANRIEKLEYISQYKLAQEHLNVCCDELENCGKCGKCFRTMLILELMGKLDLFQKSFLNQSDFQNKKWKKYVWILDKKNQDCFAKDIYRYIQNKKIKIPCIAKGYHYTLPLRKCIHGIIKKWRT